MKVIFLDLDGVLNTPKGYWVPECVEQLNRICDETKASIVISSSWKMSHSVDALRELLKKNGVTGHIFGSTLEIVKLNKRTGLYMGVDRGIEIYTWILSHCPEKYVAIDDVVDDDWMRDFTLKTEYQTGLTKEIADKVIEILK